MIQTILTIEFGPMVKPVGLSTERVTQGVATIAGFGQTGLQPRTDVKQFLEMEVMTNPACRRHYLRAAHFNAVRIFASNICFSNPPGQGACGGDSGGSIIGSGGVSVRKGLLPMTPFF